MKILHVIPSVARSYGGPSHALFQLRRALEENGVEVTIAATCDKDEESVFKTSHSLHLFPRKFPRYFFYSNGLRHWLQKNMERFDVVHIHSLFSYPAAIAASCARRFKKPYILRPFGTLDRESMKHHPLRKAIYFTLVERINLTKASMIQCTSKSEKHEIERFQLNTDHRIIPLGILPEEFSAFPRISLSGKYGIPEGKKVILFLARIHPRKGLEILLRAVEMLRKSRNDFVLVIAGGGEGKYVNSLKKSAEMKGLSDCIDWVGEVRGEKKDNFLRGADIFVLPSHRESFGLSVVEAMAAGCPVVISDQVAIHEEVQKAEAGIVVSLNPSDLRNALEALLDDANLREKKGKNGRQLVEEKFNIRKSVTELISIYQYLSCRK